MADLTGVIKEIYDCGTIVDVTITDEDSQDYSVLMEYNMVSHMIEAKGSIIGKLVTYDDVAKVLYFDEDN